VATEAGRGTTEPELALARSEPRVCHPFRQRRADRFPEPLACRVLQGVTHDLTESLLHTLDQPVLQGVFEAVAYYRDHAFGVDSHAGLRL
jgi:hypothetical protein